MEAMDVESAARKPTPRSVVGFVLSLPLLLLQLVFLADIHGWNIALSYGLFGIALCTGLIIWLVLLFVEIHVRRKRRASKFRVPWFSAAGFVFLCTFFYLGEWARPVVLRVPEWCRVSQVIRWETSMRNAKHGGMEMFILVLGGRGNIAEHRFTGGYLNWTGEGSSGLSGIDIVNRSFSDWEGYEHVTIPATTSALRESLYAPGLEESEVSRISSEIWEVINQADHGQQIRTVSGLVEPIWESPFDQEDVVLGAVIWMSALVVVFQFIAWGSLPASSNFPREAALDTTI